MLNRSIFTISTLVLGLLTGCATKQTWVPELEQAQKTFAEISQDPIVANLADEDLKLAERQLRSAEDAAAAFRKPQSIAHKARLAELQTLTAQQRARALTANHGVQTALGQNPLLPQEKVAAATFTPASINPEPVIAAATTGSDADIRQQLMALSKQLASLQAQLSNSQNQSSAALPESSDARLLAPAGSLSMAPQQAAVQKSIRSALVEMPAVSSTSSSAVPMNSIDNVENQLVPQEFSQSTNLATTQNSLPTYKDRQIQHKLRAMNAKPNARGMSLLLGERYFDSGSDRLVRQRAARHLDNVAAVLTQNPDLDLLIEGHTDNKLAVADSRDLSVNRAISVKSALVIRGIEAGRITTQGFGHTRPIAENATALGRLQNQRVELIFPVTPL